MSRPLFAAAALLAATSAPATAEAGKKSGFRNHVYVRPSMGVNSFTPENGDTVSIMNVGGVAGINYWEAGRQVPRLRGNARVSGDYVVGASDLSGYQVRVGNFTGPLWETVGFTIGPDFFYSQYQYGDTEFPAAGGVGVPLTVDAYVSAFSVFGGIEPAWYLVGDRPGRDWSTAEGAPGFGHEFAYFAGVGMNVGGLNVGGSVRHTMSAYGEQNTFGISASFDGEIGGKKGKGKGKKGGKGKGKKGR